MIKKVFLLLFLQGILSCLSAQEDLVKQAETAYTNEDYAKAIELYEDIILNYGDSHEIYFNLGNAYYKTGQIAPAILNYERALLINPGDADTRFNIEMSKTKAVDRIEPLDDFFIVKWFRSIQNIFNVDTWAAIGIASFIIFIGCLVLFFFSKWMRLRKLGFYLGCVLFVMIIISNIFAYNQKEALVNRNGAIIFVPTVTIKSSPDNSGTDLFVLHEGTKVFIKSSVGEWNEIELEDGNVGWIHKKNIEKI